MKINISLHKFAIPKFQNSKINIPMFERKNRLASYK